MQELQTIAHEAGHPVPLLIALDQENGGVNSLYDDEYICQFPSAMGVAATNSLDLAFDVAKATALEVSAVGVNMILGPVLDVLTNARYQPLGARATGDDAQECSQYGIATMKGFKESGLTTCGKHWPSYGDLNFLGSNLDMPIIKETIDQLKMSALVPFQQAIKAGIDAIMVGGCAIANSEMNVMHACLSEQVVDDLLRKDLGFDGVVISECLEMDSLSNDIGVRSGTVMATLAGCDLILLCRSFQVQLEAISGMKIGIENEMISIERLNTSLRRVLSLKKNATSWQTALNPPGLSLLSKIHPSHQQLSVMAYDNSITVMRDNAQLLPLSKMDVSDELLLLTPLLKPLPASAATKFLSETALETRTRPSSVHDIKVEDKGEEHRKRHTGTIDAKMDRGSIMSGEGVFRELGKALARQRHGKLLHTSYTANGVRPTHEHLIERASVVIIVTADANRNLYQTGFTKHVAMMCSMYKKAFMVVSVSSPYDFAMDKLVGTYLCTYDFTETAMAALVRVLFGERVARGSLPGTLRKGRKVQAKSRTNWLVEKWDAEKDTRGLNALLDTVRRSNIPPQLSPLAGATAASFQLSDSSIQESHYVVRNSSTHALYGFCSTYIHGSTGYIGSIFVDPAKRNLSIGRSLHQRAIRNFLQKGKQITDLRLGIGLPSIFAGVPTTTTDDAALRGWFAKVGWPSSGTSKSTASLLIANLADWAPADDLVKSIQRVPYDFDLVHGVQHFNELQSHLSSHASWEVSDLYRLALADEEACGIVRAKRRSDGQLAGTVILCRHGTKLTKQIPLLVPITGFTGGILSPVLDPSSVDSLKLLQGLLLLGIRQNKAHRANISYLNPVSCEIYIVNVLTDH